MSILYVMSRDGELPGVFQKLNSFGAPWVARDRRRRRARAIVLLFAHDLETLASLYAIGVVGAVAINCTLCSLPPAPAQVLRKIAMVAAGGCSSIAIWVTLAFTKLHALVFVTHRAC